MIAGVSGTVKSSLAGLPEILTPRKMLGGNAFLQDILETIEVARTDFTLNVHNTDLLATVLIARLVWLENSRSAGALTLGMPIQKDSGRRDVGSQSVREYLFVPLMQRILG